MTDNITHTFDIARLNWDLLDDVANTRLEKLRKMREGIRRHLMDVGQHCGSARLVTWAMNVRPESLNFLTHLGFMESHLWEVLTMGTLTREKLIKGRLAFTDSSHEQEQAEQFAAGLVADVADQYGAAMERIDLPGSIGGTGWKIQLPRPAHDGQNRTGGKP